MILMTRGTDMTSRRTPGTRMAQVVTTTRPRTG